MAQGILSFKYEEEKKYGNIGAGRITSISGSGKYSLYVSAIRHPSPSARVTLYPKQGAV
jgi:hypothetical protein